MQRRITRFPAFALISAVLFLAATWVLLGRVAEDCRVSASRDPAQFTNWGLSLEATRHDFEREVRSSLAEGKLDLAKDILAWTLKHNVSIDAALIESVRKAGANQDATTVQAARAFAAGLLTGEATDAGSVVGAMVGDAFFVGDLRDLGRESFHCLSGRRCDSWTLGLAACGIAVTLTAYATSGAAAPERVGLSVLKEARRLGRLNPRLVRGIVSTAAEDARCWSSSRAI
jgi:hypothetical protein